MRRWLVLGTVVLTAAGCVGGGSDDEGGGTGPAVTIGLLAPLTGPSAPAGIDARRGAELAADLINNPNPAVPLPLADSAGLRGLGGAKVSIRTVDTTSERAAAETAARTLTADPAVAAVIGAYDPAATTAAAAVAGRAGKPFVNADSPTATFAADGKGWTFHLGPTVRDGAESLFAVLNSQRRAGIPIKRMILLRTDNQAGADVRDALRGVSTEAGMVDVEDMPFAPDAKDVTAQVRVVKERAPDVVFVAAGPATVRPVVAAFAKLAYRPPSTFAFGVGYLGQRDFTADADTVTGACRVVSWSAEAAARNPAAREVAALYERKYGAPMTEVAAAEFTAVLTVAMAADGAGSSAPAALRGALHGIDVPGSRTIMPWAGIRFDAGGRNTGTETLVEQYWELRFSVVSPVDVASRTMAWPGTTPNDVTP